MSWDKIESYNVVYTVLGQTDRSAMPIGNGELCASVWMTEDGKLKFYFGRTDCLGEDDMTLKHGMIEIETVPSFLSEGGYRQTLILKEGKIEVESSLGKITVFVSGENHTIYAMGDFTKEVTAKAKYRSWRTKDLKILCENPDALEEKAKSSPWTIPIVRTADVVEYGEEVCFYHKNGKNGIKELAKFEGVEDTSLAPDFLTNRIFGGVLQMKDSVLDEQLLKTRGASFEISITTASGQYDCVDDWKEELKNLQKKNISAKEAMEKTAVFWNRFWENSYVFVSGDTKIEPQYTEDIMKRAKETRECNDAPSQVTRAYLLTKFMTACCKDGNFPLFYNGFLFNLTPGNGEHLAVETFAGTFTSQPLEDANEEFNPDERSWSWEHLWQNLRLPYYAMLAAGDFESLKKMFHYYLRFQKLNEARAEAYYGARGIHNTEMTLSCGLQCAPIYGMDRENLKVGQAANQWGGSIEISPGLELLNLMLDYCIYSGDNAFLSDEVVGYAKKTFEYIETRFGRDTEGKIYFSDINSIETYFHTSNPTPILAGMICDLQKILTLPVGVEDQTYFQEILSKTPEIPTAVIDGEEVIIPAKEYKDERWNVEIPEFYTVYPFALYTKGAKNEEIAVRTFHTQMKKTGNMRPYVIGEVPGKPAYSGWQYVGMTAAMLGMTAQCKEILENNAGLQNPGNRFPAMWGACYDSVPDVDHGANIMNLLQLMLLQSYGEELQILPAFPKEWNVKFKLHAPGRKVVECTYLEGEIKTLKVTVKGGD